MRTSHTLLALILASVLAVGLVQPVLAAFLANGPAISVFQSPDEYVPVKPDVAMAADGRFVAVWTNWYYHNGHPWVSIHRVLVRRFAADGTPLGDPFAVSTGDDGQETAVIGMAPDGRFVVAWWSARAGGIVARRFAADGTAQGDEFRVTPSVNDGTTAIAMAPDGRFVIAWACSSGANSAAICAQRFAADGTTQGGLLAVAPTAAYAQGDPSVAMAADGSFVISWASPTDIYARRYGADGSAQGDQFHVNWEAAFDVGQPSVGLAADGRFAIAWYHRSGASPMAVHAQRYAAGGWPEGGELHVNTTVLAESTAPFPTVRMAADGRFVVVYAGTPLNENQSVRNIYAQRYAANGGPDGEEVRANDSGYGTYISAALGFGRLVVIWTTGSGIAGQRYIWGDPPVARGDTYTVSGPTLSVPGPGVLANDYDPDGAAMSVVLASGPEAGAVTLNPNGSFTYTPGAGFKGTDRFSYLVSDGYSMSSPATVAISGYASACQPRPRVQTVPAAGGGHLSVTVTATPQNGPAPNALLRVEFGTFQNARVTLGGQPISSGQVVTLPPNTPGVAISVQRAVPGQSTTVPLTVVDGCGSWRTFVGGGTGAAF